MRVSAKDQQGDVGLYAVAAKITDELKWIFRPQPHRDLGIDAIVEVVEAGVSNGELLALQVKSGESWFREKTAAGIVFRFDEEHYTYWNKHPLPVLVVLHQPVENIAYWEVVNENTVTNTGKGWKIEVPQENTLSIQNKESIRKFCDFELPENCYGVTSFKDLSHGGAKRYQARVILNRELSRGEIVQIITKATNEFRDREYYRSELTQDVWRGKQASVVWLFVFPSLEDEKNSNWLCRSEWVDPSLDERLRPMKMAGMAIGEDLVIDWSENYRSFAKWHSSVTLSKEDYLKQVGKILTPLMKSAEKAEKLYKEYNDGKIDPAEYLRQMKRLQRTISALYIRGTEIGGAPLECNDFSERFQSLIASADNIVLPFSEKGLGTWAEKNRDFLVKDAIKNYSESVLEMQYEYKKLH